MTTKFKTVQSKFNASKQRRYMMQTGTIVRRNANSFIPNDYLEKVLAANPHGWGAAMTSDGELQLNSSDEGATLEFIQETMKTFPDKDITFYFCSSEGGLSMQDISPYVLVVKKEGDEEIPQIVAFIEGNFPGHAKKDSSHPAEYHLASDYLVPKLESLYEMADGDLTKVTEQLKKPFFKKELLLTSVSRGTITLVCANGVSLTFAQNDLSSEYPWGWVSNNHGYAAGPPKEKKEDVPPKKASMFPSRSTVREKAPTPSPAIAEATKPPATETTAIKNYTTKKEKPPAHLSRKDKKNWYKMKIGYCPTGWENGVAIDCYVDENGKVLTISQVKALGLEAAGLPKTDNPPREKDVESDNIPQPKEVEQKQVTAEILPLVSPASKQHVLTMLKDANIQKTISENADIILDPKRVQALEAKFADFAHQLGSKSMDEFAQWSYEMMYDLAKTKPDALAVMCWTFRNEWAKKRTAEVKAEVKAEEKKSMFPKRNVA